MPPLLVYPNPPCGHTSEPGAAFSAWRTIEPSARHPALAL